MYSKMVIKIRARVNILQNSIRPRLLAYVHISTTISVFCSERIAIRIYRNIREVTLMMMLRGLRN